MPLATSAPKGRRPLAKGLTCGLLKHLLRGLWDRVQELRQAAAYGSLAHRRYSPRREVQETGPSE